MTDMTDHGPLPDTVPDTPEVRAAWEHVGEARAAARAAAEASLANPHDMTARREAGVTRSIAVGAFDAYWAAIAAASD